MLGLKGAYSSRARARATPHAPPPCRQAAEQQQAPPSGAPHWGGGSPASSRRAAAPRRPFLPPVPWRYPRGGGGLRVRPLPPLPRDKVNGRRRRAVGGAPKGERTQARGPLAARARARGAARGWGASGASTL